MRSLAAERQDVVPGRSDRSRSRRTGSRPQRWTRWQIQAGRLGFGVDAAHWGWWQARRTLAMVPDVRQTDAFLRNLGAEVVHFDYPIRFGTTLPFLYEPWDLQHRHHPEFFTPSERRWRDQMYREGCEQARLIVTATRFTKLDSWSSTASSRASSRSYRAAPG